MKLANGNTVTLRSGGNELIIQGDKGKIRVNRGSLTGKPIEKINTSQKDREWLDAEVRAIEDEPEKEQVLIAGSTGCVGVQRSIATCI